MFRTIKPLLKNSRGASLILVLMITIALGAMALVFMRVKQTNIMIANRYDADADINEAMTRISALLNTPTHCNSNFYNISSANGSLPTLYSCTSGSCKAAPNRTAVIIPTTTNWTLFQGEQARNARVIGMSYAITEAQQTGANRKPATLTLTIQFQKKIGRANGVETIAPVNKTAQAYVVTNTYNYGSWALNAGTGFILGCPRAPSSTIVY